MFGQHFGGERFLELVSLAF